MNEGLPSYPTFSLAMEENTYPIDIPSEEEWRNSIMSIFEDNPQHVTVGPELDIPVSGTVAMDEDPIEEFEAQTISRKLNVVIDFVQDDDIETIDIVDAIISAPSYAKGPDHPARVKIPQNKILNVVQTLRGYLEFRARILRSKVVHTVMRGRGDSLEPSSTHRRSTSVP